MQNDNAGRQGHIRAVDKRRLERYVTFISAAVMREGTSPYIFC